MTMVGNETARTDKVYVRNITVTESAITQSAPGTRFRMFANQGGGTYAAPVGCGAKDGHVNSCAGLWHQRERAWPTKFCYTKPKIGDTWLHGFGR